MKKLLLTASVALILSACGSKHKDNQPKPTPTPSARPTATATPTPTATPPATPAPAANSGLALTVGEVEGKLSGGTTVRQLSSKDFSNVQINGVNYDLSRGSYKQKITGTDRDSELYNSDELKYARYGYIEQDMKNSKQEWQNFYYLGQKSTSVPTSGSATYRGTALHSSRLGDDPTRASAQFNVDFGTKKLTGSINNQLNLNADIQGAEFRGTSAAGVQTTGSFFGPNAAEMAGIYNGNQVHGSFGATKQ